MWCIFHHNPAAGRRRCGSAPPLGCPDQGNRRPRGGTGSPKTPVTHLAQLASDKPQTSAPVRRRPPAFPCDPLPVSPQHQARFSRTWLTGTPGHQNHLLHIWLNLLQISHKPERRYGADVPFFKCSPSRFSCNLHPLFNVTPFRFPLDTGPASPGPGSQFHLPWMPSPAFSLSRFTFPLAWWPSAVLVRLHPFATQPLRACSAKCQFSAKN